MTAVGWPGNRNRHSHKVYLTRSFFLLVLLLSHPRLGQHGALGSLPPKHCSDVYSVRITLHLCHTHDQDTGAAAGTSRGSDKSRVCSPELPV